MDMKNLFCLAAVLIPATNATAADNGDLRVCTDNSRGCLEKTARLYLDALVSADDSKVPLAHDVQRKHVLGNGGPVNAGKTIVGEAAMRASIRQEQLLSRSEPRLFTDEARQQVVALWETATEVPSPRTVTVMDRLWIDKGLIREVEVISAVRQGAADAAKPAPDKAAEPLIEALRDISRKLWSFPYATSSDTARQNTEKYLAGLFSQAWTFTQQVSMLPTPYFNRAMGVEGLPGLYNPDNLYRSALLESGGVYRVYGRRGTHDDLSFQVIDRYPIVGLGRNLAVIRPDLSGTKPGDEFEFYLGGEARTGSHWYPLAGEARAILARQTFGSWQQTPTELYIERIDAPAFRAAENPFAQVAQYMRQATQLWVDGYLPEIQRDTPVNALPPLRGSPEGAGGLGGQMSVMARYSLKPDEALLITVRRSAADYQGIQLGDPWFVTPNTIEHQVSLTARQSHVDEDGMIRFVIALNDPGVPNWLDPAGNPDGYIFMRWQGMKTPLGQNDAPTARLVKIHQLKKLMPASTPHITPEKRRQALSNRRWAPQIR